MDLTIPRTQRHTNSKVRQLKCGTLNIRSMRNKLDEVNDLIRYHQLHSLAVTKTWQENAECITIKRLGCQRYNVTEAAKPPPPQPVDEDIDYINHAGIAIISKSGVLVAMIDVKFKASSLNSFLCCRLTLAGASLIVVTIYRPGSQPTSVLFFKELSKLLQRLAIYSTPVTMNWRHQHSLRTANRYGHVQAERDIHAVRSPSVCRHAQP